MVDRADTRHLVATEEKGVLPPVRQWPDAPLGKAVVYRVAAVFPVHGSVEEEAVEHEVGHQAGCSVRAGDAFYYRLVFLAVHREVAAHEPAVLVLVFHYLILVLCHYGLLVVCVVWISLYHDSSIRQLAQVAPVVHVVVGVHRAVCLPRR